MTRKLATLVESTASGCTDGADADEFEVRSLAERLHGFAWAEGPLVDAEGRRITYLRLSLTDRCDLACVYCMPPSGEDDHAPRPELLTFEEIVRLVRALFSAGIRTVRFTGGEPLVRRNALDLVRMVSGQTPVTDLAMTTNGTRLEELATPLRQAGLRRINVSVDTLRADSFAAITRGGDLAKVLAGIGAAIEAGFEEVKINVVALRGINDHELGDLVDWAWQMGVTPRFIELMPIGEGAKLGAARHLGVDEIRARLGARLSAADPQPAGVEGRGPASYVAAADGSDRRVGFITAVSHSFCRSCNRMRVTARGDMRACLASRRSISLRDVLREGRSDEEVVAAVRFALGRKHEGHYFGSAEMDEHRHVGMSLIGG